MGKNHKQVIIGYNRYALYAFIPVFMICIFICSACVPGKTGTPLSTYMKGEHILLQGGVPADMQSFGDTLDANLDSLRARYKVAGVAVAMIEGVRAGDVSVPEPRLIQSGTAGRDEKGQWHAMDARTTLFDVASLTKRLVAWTLIHNQAELGIDITKSPFEAPNDFSLSDCEWNPWTGGAYPSAQQGFTLGAVIRHEAGLTMEGLNELYPWGWPAWLYGPGMPLEDALPSICQDLGGLHNTSLTGRMVFKENLVGKFKYSSGNYGLLQMLIDQKTTQAGFDTCMQKVMEEELGMQKSTFDYDPVGYLAKRRGQNGSLFLSRNYRSYATQNVNVPEGLRLLVNKACGGLFGTVDDYAKFAARLMSDGIRPGTIDDINIFCDDNRFSRFDDRHFPTAEGYDAYIFRGELQGWATHVILDPARGNALVIFTNTADPVGDTLGYGTGENLIREVYDTWMLASGYGPTLKRIHEKFWYGKTVKACEPYYGE
jgi:CubicO group peptidase (beta-lactamase class C family)